ncbi:hypothetical protein GCM10010358_82590 [Streptomyces minutiscleroticus]|uniref:Uncharacterized protein n=1 Tax=Streptomyces minutiscleroticus TaxID=68238 RepID=A0A918P4H3_9ACTN|nr:hypothetical protein GCM10010358_82590 [Streptomyces minutiscleroticus]
MVQADSGPRPGGRSAKTRGAASGAVRVRGPGSIGSGGVCKNAVRVSVTFRACVAPDAAAALAVPPISRTGRSSAAAAASRSAGVRCHSFSVTRLPAALSACLDSFGLVMPIA